MTDPSDALRDLANATGGGGPTPSSRPESPIAADASSASRRPEAPPVDPGMASASALAELSGSGSVGFDPGLSSAGRHRIPKPDVGMMQFRSAAVPVLITVGLIMLALGVWGVLVKAGNTTLPLADRPEAGMYATVGLIGLPLALCLFAGAGFFLYQLGIDKKKLAAYESAKRAARGR